MVKVDYEWIVDCSSSLCNAPCETRQEITRVSNAMHFSARSGCARARFGRWLENFFAYVRTIAAGAMDLRQSATDTHP